LKTTNNEKYVLFLSIFFVKNNKTQSDIPMIELRYSDQYRRPWWKYSRVGIRTHSRTITCRWHQSPEGNATVDLSNHVISMLENFVILLKQFHHFLRTKHDLTSQWWNYHAVVDVVDGEDPSPSSGFEPRLVPSLSTTSITGC